MKHSYQVIDIVDSKVRLLVGTVVDDKPVVSYVSEKEIPNAVFRGDVSDFPSLNDYLASFTSFNDEKARVKLEISDATVLYPPLGFQVYKCLKSTNVGSSSDIVDNIDIENLLEQVRKETAPSDSEFVDIIPDAYYLDEDRSRPYSEAPIGSRARRVSINAQVHTLPRRIVKNYKDVFKNTNINITKRIVTPFALCALANQQELVSGQYVIVDMSNGYTSISLCHSKYPVFSTHFLLGENDLISKIDLFYGIGKEKAIELLDLYGYDNRDLGFYPALLEFENQNGEKKTIEQKDLNNIIISFFDDYFRQFDNSLSTILQKAQNTTFDVVVINSPMSEYHGIEELIKNHFTNMKPIFLKPKSIGARSAKYSACVGSLLLCHKYSNTFASPTNIVSQLSRVEKK